MKVLRCFDAALCADIHASAFPDAWSEASFAALLQGSGVEARVVGEQGVLLTRMVVDEMEILTIAVRPEARRQGIAKALMQDALSAAKNQGISQVFLEVDAENTAAIKLYQALGFAQISIRKQYYKTPTESRDAWVMRL